MAEKTQSGMDQNVAGLLCYLAGWITGLIFVLIEKENKFVRFHAFQSLLVFAPLSILQIVIGVLAAVVPVIAFLSILVGLASLVAWVFLMIKAYQNETFKLPVVGDMAAKYAGL